MSLAKPQAQLSKADLTIGVPGEETCKSVSEMFQLCNWHFPGISCSMGVDSGAISSLTLSDACPIACQISKLELLGSGTPD